MASLLCGPSLLCTEIVTQKCWGRRFRFPDQNSAWECPCNERRQHYFPLKEKAIPFFFFCKNAPGLAANIFFLIIGWLNFHWNSAASYTNVQNFISTQLHWCHTVIIVLGHFAFLHLRRFSSKKGAQKLQRSLRVMKTLLFPHQWGGRTENTDCEINVQLERWF